MVRILQTPVSPLFPFEGPVRVMLYGEAPGPLGADKSHIPFWGDRAGVAVYQALEKAGMAVIPPGAYEDWDGQRLKDKAWKPELRGAALSNSYPSCPTKDGQTFHAPTEKELRAPANVERIRQELSMAIARCDGKLRVVAMGRKAAGILASMRGQMEFELCELPHPSAQGLLQAAPGKGRGLKLEDLRAAWMEKLMEMLRG